MKKKKYIDTEKLLLIRNSLVQIHPISDQIAKSFYARLFEVTPHLQNLFTGDMNRQGTMLMTSLELAVSNLDDPETIFPAIQALGERHLSYGVKPAYYLLAKDAYLWALEKHLGKDFTPRLKGAWGTALDSLINVMAISANQ